MQQGEARSRTISRWIARVKRSDLCSCTVEQRLITINMLGVSISPIAQQRELGVAFGIGEKVQLQLMCQCLNSADTGQHRRDHHHHAMLVRYAADERKARQVLGLCRFADQAINDRNHRLRGREYHQNHGE